MKKFLFYIGIIPTIICIPFWIVSIICDFICCLIEYYYDWLFNTFLKEKGFISFGSPEECWEEMKKHKPFGWLKCGKDYWKIIGITANGVRLADDYDTSNKFYSFDFLYKYYNFADNKRFGIKK